MIELRWLNKSISGADSKYLSGTIKVLQFRKLLDYDDGRHHFWTQWEDVPVVEEEK